MSAETRVTMKIKTLRKKTGLSQNAFARRFGIPVRTLQQWEQGKSAPPAYVISMMERLLESEGDYEAPIQEDAGRHHISPRTHWRVRIDDPFENCDRVYPIQQRKVRELIDDISQNPEVEQIRVFGSSVTEKCHMNSDVDLCVSMSSPNADAGTLVSQPHDFPFDLWTDSMLDERLRREIMEKGVIVYG